MGIHWNKVLKARNIKKEVKSIRNQTEHQIARLQSEDSKLHVQTRTMKHISKYVSDFWSILTVNSVNFFGAVS